MHEGGGGVDGTPEEDPAQGAARSAEGCQPPEPEPHDGGGSSESPAQHGGKQNDELGSHPRADNLGTSIVPPTASNESALRRIANFFYPRNSKKKTKKNPDPWAGGPGASRGQDQNNLD